jgi:Na+/H+ antiporter NhaD/arsenite permease-like protein
MTAVVIFFVAYVGIALGKVPGLALDRVGVAVLGAIAMVVSGAVPADRILAAIDLPTILLLYSLMIISAQLRLGGFYTLTALSIIPLCRRPKFFLLVIMLVSAGLSALLANDIVCFAFTPVLSGALLTAGLNPFPFLFALAVASNIGSAATIIGNPQNMLIGQTARLNFMAFSRWSLPPSLLALAAGYLVLLLVYRRHFAAQSAGVASGIALHHQPFDRHQTIKGLVAVGILLVLFFLPIPRELSALGIAGVLLCSRRIKTRDIMGLIDWQLITLFCALFVIIAGLKQGGFPELVVAKLMGAGINLQRLDILSTVTLVLSNLCSNVPAVMLLVNFLDPQAHAQWYTLAMASTFAGNLFLLGSIANLIVAEQAQAFGIKIGVGEHARVGIPVTCASFGALFLWIGWQ